MEMRAGHERADTIATTTIVRGDVIVFNKKKLTKQLHRHVIPSPSPIIWMNVEDSAITLSQHTRKAPIMQSQSTNKSLDFVPNGLLFSNTNDTGYQAGDGDGTSTGGTIDKRVEDEDELMESGSDYYSADEIDKPSIVGSPGDIQDGTPKATVSRWLRKTRSKADVVWQPRVLGSEVVRGAEKHRRDSPVSISGLSALDDYSQ